MVANYVQSGDRLTFTAAADVTGGHIVSVGTLFGVAHDNVANGAEGVIYTEGVFKLPKAAPLVISAGDEVFWVSASSHVNKTALDNLFVGCAVEDAASAATEVAVRLQQYAPAPETT